MLENIIDSIRDPNHISAPIAVGAVCYFIGMALKKSPLADWLIPFILLAIGGATYPFIGDPTAVYPPVPQLKLAMFGVIYAGTAVFGNQLIQQFRNRPKKVTGDTQFIEKTKEPNPKD